MKGNIIYIWVYEEIMQSLFYMITKAFYNFLSSAEKPLHMHAILTRRWARLCTLAWISMQQMEICNFCILHSSEYFCSNQPMVNRVRLATFSSYITAFLATEATMRLVDKVKKIGILNVNFYLYVKGHNIIKIMTVNGQVS